ncbi:MAG: phosphate ABC transporter permease PtsA [Planctomycetota bacterium]|nr:MAG: phosphate ABC transporter permease PtsA [Planctomycetota bacterium]
MALSVREVFSATPIDRRRRRTETIAGIVCGIMTLLLVVPLVLILGHLVVKAWPALSVSFLFENPRTSMTAGGIWAPLVGTFYLVFISLLVASPIGILAGVYLNEYAKDNWFTRIVNLAVVNLAGVPSIVHALFGVGAFVLFAGMGESVLAASCTLAVMTLPVIISSTKEALASVPMTFREACWNMGASRWQTIRTIVLPNSISGILTGVILQVSRAAGETAPILFTGAAFFLNVPDKGLRYFLPYSLDDSCMALSYHLYVLMTQVKGASDEQIAAGNAMPLEHLQYGTAVVLIGLVLAVNSVSIGLRVYLRSHKKW